MLPLLLLLVYPKHIHGSRSQLVNGLFIFMAKLELSCFLIRSTVSRELPCSGRQASAGLRAAMEPGWGRRTIIGWSVVVSLSSKHIVKPEDPVVPPARL